MTDLQDPVYQIYRIPPHVFLVRIQESPLIHRALIVGLGTVHGNRLNLPGDLNRGN